MNCLRVQKCEQSDPLNNNGDERVSFVQFTDNLHNGMERVILVTI